MTDHERYRRAFSHAQAKKELTWEDFSVMKTKKRPLPHRMTALIASLALLCALGTGAVAANFLGLKDLLLPQRQEVTTHGKTWEVDSISLSGYMDSPESRALAQWEAFLAEYDKDRAILYAIGNYLDPAFEKYNCYLVYTQDMADKLEEIAAKYDLKLHTDMVDLYAHPEALGPLAEFSAPENNTYWTYMYEDGSCALDGDAYVPDWGLVGVQFMRSVKGVFNDVTLNVGDASEYQQWTYRTASGIDVALALGPGKSLIYADLPDCFAVFNVLAGSEDEMTPQRLEAVCECYDFSKLSPVVPPAIPAETAPR